MAAFDFSSSFAGINGALANLGKTLQAKLEREDLGVIGNSLSNGSMDYNQAAGKLLSLGRPDAAVEFLKMGEARRQRTAGEDAARALGTAIGGMDSGGAPIVAPSANSNATGSALPVALNTSESGGNWQAQNDAVGAGGARGHFGRAQFGQARLQEAIAAGAIPSGTTPQAFMQSPELQKAAENWHFGDIDKTIRDSGMGTLIGKSIGGVPVTLDGLRAVAHLGGKGGLAKFVASGGRYNPSDANGTSLTDYLRLGAGSSGVQSAAADMPALGAAAASLDTGTQGFAVPVQPAMTGRTFDAITAGGQPVRPAFEAEGVSQPWMGSTLLRLGQRLAQTATADVLPPRRPYDLSADLPAQRAVPAMGRMPSPIDRAGAVDIDPNSNDAGALRLLVASEEARRGLPGGAGIMNPLDNFRSAPPGPASTQLGAVPASVAADRAADLPARNAVATQGTMPTPAGTQAVAMPSSELPRPTDAQSYRELGETKNMEMRRGKAAQLATALANPNLPANARAVGEIFLKEALEQSKAPDSVKEFMYARGMGWTTAKSPAEYAAEKDKAKKNTADETVQEREAAAARAGLKPGDTGYQGYILTGKMPREDMGPLTATDKKAIMEADDAVLSAQTVIENLTKAKQISKEALSGPGSAAAGYLRSFLPDGYGGTAGQATVDLNNLVTTNALGQLKAIFGGNPTEGERAILLEIQGSSNLPDAARQKVYDRAIALAQRRLDFNKQRATELRGGDYYKSPEKRAQGGGNQPSNQQRQAGQRVQVSSPEEAYRLPKGTPIILPDGRVGEVP